MKVYLLETLKECLTGNAEGHWEVLTRTYLKRPYHNLSHLGYMVNMLQIYADHNADAIGSQAEMNELLLAVLLHDYVYDVRRDDNEAASAEFAGRFSASLYAEMSLSRIKNLILATSHDEKLPKNRNAALIRDLDLAVLGTFEEQVWKSYNDGIRREYDIYDDSRYIPARIKVLESFLNRERIFGTDFFRDMFERQARKNLMTEIQRLKAML